MTFLGDPRATDPGVTVAGNARLPTPQERLWATRQLELVLRAGLLPGPRRC